MDFKIFLLVLCWYIIWYLCTGWSLKIFLVLQWANSILYCIELIFCSFYVSQNKYKLECSSAFVFFNPFLWNPFRTYTEFSFTASIYSKQWPRTGNRKSHILLTESYLLSFCSKINQQQEHFEQVVASRKPS